MTDDQLLYSLAESSLFDTYLFYGIIGFFLTIALVGVVTLLTTSYCCFNATQSCYCCCPCRRHSSYELNAKKPKLTHIERRTYVKRHSSDITDFSHLYESYPHLINSKTTLTSGKNTSVNFDSSLANLNTQNSTVSPCISFRSLTQPVSPVKLHVSNLSQQTKDNTNSSSTAALSARPFSYIKNPNECSQIFHRLSLRDRSISPSVVSIDMTTTPSFESDTNNQTYSPCTNIYEAVIPTANNNSSSSPSTPIYESEWKHNLKQIVMNKLPSMDKNAMSVIELPSLQSDSVSSNHFFQQHSLYGKFLENRTKISDSMRRANMLKRLNDDAAFLY